MPRTVIVRYTTRPEAADENQHLIEQVYAELASTNPGGLRYATFRLADGVSFVHIGVVEGDANPLDRTAAFAAFTRNIDERSLEPPRATQATLVGDYRFFAA
jgi:hypothetical protein